MRRINYIRLGVAVMIAVTASFYYCSKKENNPVEKDLQQNSSVNFLLNGKWMLTEVVSPGNYVLKDFNGFHFTFSSNAVLYASRDGNTFKGTWSMGKDNMERTKLYINFGDQAILNELNNDWLVTEMSQNTLKLSFATGTNENGGTGNTSPSGARFYEQRLTFVVDGGIEAPQPQNPSQN